jgi:hypothetical protein
VPRRHRQNLPRPGLPRCSAARFECGPQPGHGCPWWRARSGRGGSRPVPRPPLRPRPRRAHCCALWLARRVYITVPLIGTSGPIPRWHCSARQRGVLLPRLQARRCQVLARTLWRRSWQPGSWGRRRPWFFRRRGWGPLSRNLRLRQDRPGHLARHPARPGHVSRLASRHRPGRSSATSRRRPPRPWYQRLRLRRTSCNGRWARMWAARKTRWTCAIWRGGFCPLSNACWPLNVSAGRTGEGRPYRR